MLTEWQWRSHIEFCDHVDYHFLSVHNLYEFYSEEVTLANLKSWTIQVQVFTDIK